ncbi:MAG: beta-galactosidase [Spirochaetia bacterium]
MKLTDFLFGAAYYPEHWTFDERRDDPARMRELGFNTVRIGEFAWSLMESEEGKYDFSFFDKEIERLSEAGISIIFGTPTAAPPRWMTDKHPGILRIDKDGKSLKHGSRQQACIANSVFREYCRKITAALESRYRGNKNIIGWQIDNEIYCHFKDCYCSACRKGFQEFLEKKYGSVEKLNEDWGNSFWSLDYNSFDQIDLPYPGRPTHLNPSHVLDYRLFQSDIAVSFVRDQYEILKSSRKDWFVTHNGTFNGIDYRDMCRYLDIFSHDNYPMFIPRGKRAAWAAKNLDAAASFRGNFIIPEEQSGPGGQGDYLQETPLPGEIRLLFWQGAARGADGILFFRLRTCRFGAEQYWKGILDQDNLPNRRFAEVKKIGEEVRNVGRLLLGTEPVSDIGILYDTGLPELSHGPISHGLPSPKKLAEIIHSSLYGKGYGAGFIHPEDDFSRKKLIILPSWGIVPPGLAEKLASFAEAGGKILVTGRSGIKDSRNIVLDVPPPGPLADLCGVEVEEAFRLRQPGEWAVKADEFPVHDWAEKLRVTGGKAVMIWNGGILDGTPACVEKKTSGGGSVMYAAVYPDEKLILHLLSRLLNESGPDAFFGNVPEDVEVAVRRSTESTDTLIFILNHSRERKEIKKPYPGIPLLNKDVELTGESFFIAPLGAEIFHKREKEDA